MYGVKRRNERVEDRGVEVTAKGVISIYFCFVHINFVVNIAFNHILSSTSLTRFVSNVNERHRHTLFILNIKNRACVLTRSHI
mmetsp:Transcript_19026/g.48631  ORF Transcript_19026/g.48631 Transcript_19026/m.48631 type:complete len:83 (+) Transcript_19026:981-1229(+)